MWFNTWNECFFFAWALPYIQDKYYYYFIIATTRTIIIKSLTSEGKEERGVH